MSENNLDQKLVESIEFTHAALQKQETHALIPKQSLKLFRDLGANDHPLIEYDDSLYTGMIYEAWDQPKCVICTSPFRSLAEHVYLEKGRQPNSVVTFFEQHYGAKLNWKQVSTHMEFHCDFRKVSTSGLDFYAGKEKLISKYKFREYDFALTVVLAELDEIRGMTCNNADLKIRRTLLVDKLTDKLMRLREKRDLAASGMLNIFEILYELFNKLEVESDKQIVLDTITELKEKVASS